MEHGDYISKAKVAAEFDFMEKHVFCYGDRDDIAEAKKRILRISAEDVVPVVRCRDCTHYNGYQYCLYFGEDVQADEFCSKAMRESNSEVV